MASTFQLVILLATMLVGPGLGQDTNHNLQEEELEVPRSNFGEATDNEDLISQANLVSFGSAKKLRKCKRSARCMKMGGSCQPMGTCPRTSLGSCTKGCDCCPKDTSQCDDNYEDWQLNNGELSQTAARSSCNSQGYKLACPLSDYDFITFLLSRPPGNQAFWLDGHQGQSDHFNYVYWNSGREIGRYVTYKNHGQNMWEFGQPVYGVNATLCVSGTAGRHLTMENCNTPLMYYCSTSPYSEQRLEK